MSVTALSDAEWLAVDSSEPLISCYRAAVLGEQSSAGGCRISGGFPRVGWRWPETEWKTQSARGEVGAAALVGGVWRLCPDQLSHADLPVI